MAKRKTFYVRADLFEAKISPRAKLVLAYLSRVSNKQGQCWPPGKRQAGRQLPLRAHHRQDVRLLSQHRPEGHPGAGGGGLYFRRRRHLAHPVRQDPLGHEPLHPSFCSLTK